MIVHAIIQQVIYRFRMLQQTIMWHFICIVLKKTLTIKPAFLTNEFIKKRPAGLNIYLSITEQLWSCQRGFVQVKWIENVGNDNHVRMQWKHSVLIVHFYYITKAQEPKNFKIMKLVISVKLCLLILISLSRSTIF